MDVKKALEGLRDDKNRDFVSSLLPGIEKSTILGAKAPQIAALSKQIKKAGEETAFLESLPHTLFEENSLHAALINLEKDPRKCFELTERFLPYVDNWAVCDSLRPKAFAKNKKLLSEKIEKWLSSPLLYTRRFAVGMLKTHFLECDFEPGQAKKVASIDCGEYYMSMMVAWYFAEALAKRESDATGYFYPGVLDEKTRKRAIQKAIDSRRISEETKIRLKEIRKKR
ncbi:MAG: DNA alkylation repair protein [Clostridia bacterium]|nr:DNA alkylation repair protein [Clostridia bacterium]